MRGDSDDFHNLSAELGRREHKFVGLRVIKRGLARFPSNVDLLSDAVQYSSSLGALDEALGFVDQLFKVPFSEWNWRAFTFVGDYYEANGQIEVAMKLYEKMREEIPDDERGYSHAGIHYFKNGRYEKAIEILAPALDKLRRCSQCASNQSILSQCYLESGHYEEAIKCASRGIEADAEERRNGGAEERRSGGAAECKQRRDVLVPCGRDGRAGPSSALVFQAARPQRMLALDTLVRRADDVSEGTEAALLSIQAGLARLAPAH